MVQDSEFVSREDHYKVAYDLSKKEDIFDLWWPWKVKVTNWNLGSGISRKRYEIESSYLGNTIIKLPIGFQIRLKYLTFGDLERTRSPTEILDAEYLANGMRKSLSQGTIIKSHSAFPNRAMRFASHILSKYSSNQKDILQSYRGVNVVVWSAFGIYSAEGFLRQGTSKLKNILKFFPCYFRQDFKRRDLFTNNYMYSLNE